MGALKWTTENMLMPLVLSIVGVFIGIYITLRVAPELTDSLRPPSCTDPQDLSLVRRDDISVESSPTQPAPQGKNWSAESLLDANTSTPWVPQQGHADGATLTFHFKQSVDLALVCVVNGQPSSEVAYQNAGKVCSVAVTTDRNQTPRMSPLNVLSVDLMQQRQALNIHAGRTATIHLRVDSTYPGLDVFDPKVDRWSVATGNVAMAEVEFYVRT